MMIPVTYADEGWWACSDALAAHNKHEEATSMPWDSLEHLVLRFWKTCCASIYRVVNKTEETQQRAMPGTKCCGPGGSSPSLQETHLFVKETGDIMLEQEAELEDQKHFLSAVFHQCPLPTRLSIVLDAKEEFNWDPALSLQIRG